MRSKVTKIRSMLPMLSVAGWLLWRGVTWDDPDGSGIVPATMCVLAALFLTLAALARGADRDAAGGDRDAAPAPPAAEAKQRAAPARPVPVPAFQARYIPRSRRYTRFR